MVVFLSSQSLRVLIELLNTKQIVNALPVYYVDKGYRYVNDIICKNTKLLEANFGSSYPNLDLWSIAFYIEIDTVDLNSDVGTNRFCTPIKETLEKTRVFNLNIQKQLIAEYEQKS